MTVKVLHTGPMLANCYILIDEAKGEAAVIDPGGYDARFSDFLNPNTSLRLKYILLTHGHYDHLLGVALLRKETGASLAIHRLDASALADDGVSLASRSSREKQNAIQADLLFEGGECLAIGAFNLEVIHTPGHTPGGVCFAEHTDRKLFTGDTLFRLTIGRTDFPGGSMEQMRDSLKKLAALEGDYEVFPGHDRPSRLSFEREHNTYMRMSL